MSDLDVMLRALELMGVPARPPQNTEGILKLPTGSNYQVDENQRWVGVTLGSWPAYSFTIYFDDKGMKERLSITGW